MTNLIDHEEYDLLYSSDKVPPNIYHDKFNFKTFLSMNKLYISFLNSEDRDLICELLHHYLSIIRSVYGEQKFNEHIPKAMRRLLDACDILPIPVIRAATHSQIFCHQSYKTLVKKTIRYECENAYFYAKPVRVLYSLSIESSLAIFRKPKLKPRTLKQIAAEAFINSKQWMFTSILDLIQYNFSDLAFTDNTQELITFYDVLLMKFVFQYFLKRNDTNFPVYKLICKCTFGLKNKEHLEPESAKSPKSFFLTGKKCDLCNAIEHHTFKKYSFDLNKLCCLCEN